MFVDADIGFEPRAVIRLMQSGHAVVAGAYRLKADDVIYPLKPISPTDEHGYAEAAALQTGFMCIRREAIGEMVKVYANRAYKTDSGETHYDLFPVGRYGDKYMSEDYGFSRLWADMGGKLMLDTTCRLSHQGFKQYAGQLQDELDKGWTLG